MKRRHARGTGVRQKVSKCVCDSGRQRTKKTDILAAFKCASEWPLKVCALIVTYQKAPSADGISFCFFSSSLSLSYQGQKPLKDKQANANFWCVSSSRASSHVKAPGREREYDRENQRGGLWRPLKTHVYPLYPERLWGNVTLSLLKVF